MVIAVSIKAQLAYMLPAKVVFEDILSHWPDCRQSFQDILPAEPTISGTDYSNVSESILEVSHDVAIEQSTESQTNYLLSLWIERVPLATRQHSEKDSALGSDMADPSIELLAPLRNFELILREYAQIPETNFDMSVEFLSEHAKALGNDQVELLLKAGAEFCKQLNLHAARAVVHQASLLHRRLTWTGVEFQLFRSGVAQENWTVINSWFQDVSKSLEELTNIVRKEMNGGSADDAKSHYAKVIFGDFKPMEVAVVPIRGTPGNTETVDTRKCHTRLTQQDANNFRLSNPQQPRAIFSSWKSKQWRRRSLSLYLGTDPKL